MLLILGGAQEGRRLAAELARRGRVDFISSVAGRVASQSEVAGTVRSGGFGGVAGLIGYLERHQIRAVVNATHPFAEVMSEHARTACAATGVPLLRFTRPGWREQAGDRWLRVPDVQRAAAGIAAESLGPVGHVLLTIGRSGVGAFAALSGPEFLIRAIEAPTGPVPPRGRLLLERGPFTVAGELSLLRRHDIDLIVTKDSGGTQTEAKLRAARELGLPVLMIDRRPAPDETRTFELASALDWVRDQLG
jgi:precorrin-6A/cobalt-precorrin-6A reductase